MSPDEAAPGNGLLLFFRVDDYEMALKRARALVDRFEEEPHLNPNTQTMEFSLRDPDGYFVTISALSEPDAKVEGSSFAKATARQVIESPAKSLPVAVGQLCLATFISSASALFGSAIFLVRIFGGSSKAI